MIKAKLGEGWPLRGRPRFSKIHLVLEGRGILPCINSRQLDESAVIDQDSQTYIAGLCPKFRFSVIYNRSLKNRLLNTKLCMISYFKSEM